MIFDQTEWLNHKNLHLRISSESLIKDKTANPMVMPKFAYLYECSLMKNVFLDFLSNRTIYTPLFLNLSLSFSFRLFSAFKEWLKVRFRQNNRENLPLECRRSSSKSHKKTFDLAINWIIWSISQVGLCVFFLIFHLVLIDYNLEL